MTTYLGAKHWKPGVLQDLVFLQRGFDITKAQQRAGDVPVFSSAGLSSWHDKAMAQGPGVIIGRKGTLGSVHYSEGDYWPHDTTLWSKSLRGNSARYVYYALKCLGLERFNVGGANPTLNRNHIHDLPIYIPEPRLQNNIVSILSAYDNLIENNQRRIALLEEAARLLYREWFVHFRFPGHEHVKIKDGLPEGWREGEVSDFYTTASGGTPSRKVPDFYTGEIPWVKTQELTSTFVLYTEETITDEAVKRSSAKLFPRNTVLIAMYGATIGQTAILSIPSTTNQACCAVMPRAPGTSFVHASLFFLHHKSDLVGLGQGAAQNNISQQVIKSFKMVLPSERVLELFSEITLPLFDQIETLQKTNIELTKARDLLLPPLMNGEIAL